MEMKPEYIVLFAVVLVIAYFVFGRRRVPKDRSFRCARCSSMAQHTPRTINAWREGKSKFFCNACHGEWVRSHPQRRSLGGGSRSGCLGVMACLVLIPIALVIGWLYV